METEVLIKELLTPTAQVALIIGIVELFKKAGFPTRFIPLLDLALGLVSGIVLYGYAFHYGILNGVMLGLAIGLSACGLFSGIKNVILPDTNEQEETEPEQEGDTDL